MAFHKINVQARLDGLVDPEVSELNRELITGFIDWCFSNRIGEHRAVKYISTLKHIAIDLNMDFDKVTKKEMEAYIGRLERSDKSNWTKHDYKIAVKKFYTWLNGGKESELTDWIKTTLSKKETRMPEELLIEEEVLKLIGAAKSPRDKALIALMWDVGARIGEIANIKIKNLTFDEYGMSVLLNGKTGPRRVRAVWSIQYIMSWLEMHPDKKNNNAMLWVNSENKPISYQAVRKQLIRITNRAKIQKRITPHLFRHSRATFLARHLTEAEMNVYFGWVQGSDMAATYVHLSGRDVDKSILKAHGITVEEDNNKPQVQQCPRCKAVNGPEALFCFKCGAAMTLKTAMSIEADKSEISTELMTAILKDPGVLAAIKNAMQSEN
jgi:site-specific recombinase XerD/ribosomal protein L40E